MCWTLRLSLILLAAAAVMAVSLEGVTASAGTYHVDVTNGNDRYPGTEAQPWRTIRHASEVLLPADTAIIHEGVYHEQIMGGKSGLPGAPITYEGTDRQKVILRGSVTVKDWQQVENRWIKRGLKPITPENAFVMIDEKRLLKRASSSISMAEGTFFLAADGTYTVRLWQDKNPNTDHLVEVYELDLAFNAGDRWTGTAKQWIVIRNLTMEKYGTYGISTDKKHPAANGHWELDRITVRLTNANGVFHCLDDWYVHDCLFTRNRIHGCQLNGARIRFINNVCSENEYFGPSEDGGCGMLIGPDESAHSCIVMHNVFENNGATNGYGCGVYLEGRSRNNRIENNLIKGGTVAGVAFFGGSFNIVINNILIGIAHNGNPQLAAAFVVTHSLEGEPTQSVGNLVAHNTVWGCIAPLMIAEPNHSIPRDELNRFVNNVFVRCDDLNPVPLLPAVLLEGNGWFECPRSGGLDKDSFKRWLQRVAKGQAGKGFSAYEPKNLIGKDPGLRDPSTGDFHLKPDSPLVDSGIPVEEVTRDKDGNPRPSGLRPDIGAYEFVKEPQPK